MRLCFQNKRSLTSAQIGLIATTVLAACDGPTCQTIGKGVQFCSDKTDLVKVEQIQLETVIPFEYKDQDFKLQIKRIDEAAQAAFNLFSDEETDFAERSVARSLNGAADRVRSEQIQVDARSAARSWYLNRTWTSRRLAITTAISVDDARVIVATGRDGKDFELIDLQAHLIMLGAFRLKGG